MSKFPPLVIRTDGFKASVFIYQFNTNKVSLSDAKMPSLKDKIEAEAIEKARKEDEEAKQVAEDLKDVVEKKLSKGKKTKNK